MKKRQPRIIRRGFSFTEILFAVVILGVGFIMVAAMFPVAIQQSKLNADETIGSAIAEAGVELVKQSTGLGGGTAVQAVAPGSGIWNRLNANLIYPADPKFGMGLLYRKPSGAPFVQVFVVPMRVNNREMYEVRDMDPEEPADPDNDPPIPSTFAGVPLWIQMINDTAGGADQIRFVTDFDDDTPMPHAAAVEGAYVIIRSDNVTDSDYAPGRSNGRVYKLGRQIDGATFELALGSDMADSREDIPRGTVTSGDPIAGQAYLFGRGFNPETRQYEGAVEAITVYTTFIPVN